MFVHRPGGQSQFSAALDLQAAERRPIRDLQAWVAGHLSGDLSVGALAVRAHMSQMYFARDFRDEVGQSPARFVERVRVEAARRLLESRRPGWTGSPANAGSAAPTRCDGRSCVSCGLRRVSTAAGSSRGPSDRPEATCCRRRKVPSSPWGGAITVRAPGSGS